MNASIIICTRNKARSLALTLDSVESLAIPDGFSCEVLVVDNGSSDGTRDMVMARKEGGGPLKYVTEPAPGHCRARNAGLSRSTGQVIVFTDDDVRPSQDWLVRLTSPLMMGTYDAVVGRIELAEDLRRPWMTNMHKHWLAAPDPEQVDKLELIGASMGFHRRVLDRVPEFDTELGPGALGFADDALFSWQLEAAGFRIGEDREALVMHHPSPDRLLRGKWLEAAEKMGRSNAYVGYHWSHKMPTRPYVRFCRTFAQHYFWRTLKRRECSSKEGIPLWELTLLERLHRLRHYLALRKSPRNYDKHGLRKRQIK